MTESVLAYLKQVEWLSGLNQIPRWHERGVRHGFEGIGHELPSFGLHLKQIHSTIIHEVTEEGTQGIVGQGDALATFLPTHRIAVKTADCVPILVFHPQFVMAIHAGWRGLAQDFVAEAASFIRAKGYELTDCEWGIGPCISPESFEIGPEVLDAFVDQPVYQDALSWATTKGRGDRWHLDLATMAVLRLRHEGIHPKQISVIRSDTRTHPELWHSYRRDGEHAGRNWSWIEHSSPGLSSLGLS